MEYRDEVAGLYQWLVGVAHKYYKSTEDCEDLAMCTIEKMLTYECTYDGRPIKAWACTIMQNKFIDEWRRTERLEIVRSDEVGEQSIDGECANILSAVYKIGKNDKGVRYAILFASGYSYDEVAKIEGVSVKVVKSRIFRGRERLRKEFC